MEYYRLLPKSPGVYFFRDAAGTIIYVGKARSLRDRVKSYFGKKESLLPKTASLVEEIRKIDHIVVESEVDALLLEANYIRKLKPKYNIAGRDGNNFPLVEISLKDRLPVVRIVHQETDPRNTYFGPYPTGSDIRGLLRFLRRVFPFVAQQHKEGEVCFYYHLGLCPCGHLAGYPKNLKKLIQVLKGERTKVRQQLEKEMLAYSKRQKFEQALAIKHKLEQMDYIASAQYRPWQYEQNPNLVSDKRDRETEQLKQALGLEKLEKIEAYDIANLAGKSATGAQVTFVHGEPEKKFYRRYRIKLKSSPDDYAMLREVLSRRLKSDVPLPELFVIDGGKGQLSVAKEVLKDLSGIKAVGLAKKLETVYTDDSQEIHLPPDSPALHLLQRLRDEAHRFSRKYHFYLRSKKMLA